MRPLRHYRANRAAAAALSSESAPAESTDVSPLFEAVATRLRFAHAITCAVDERGATFTAAARVARASDAELAERVRVVVEAPTVEECERLLTAHFVRLARLVYAALVLEDMEGSSNE